MNISFDKVDLLTITGVQGVDPVRVVLQDLGPGQGRVIIGCFGSAWEHYWGGMGGGTVRQFIATGDSEYIIHKLATAPFQEPDWNALSDELDEGVTNYFEAGICLADIQAKFGPDWPSEIPETDTAEVAHLKRIVPAVIAACRELEGLA